MKTLLNNLKVSVLTTIGSLLKLGAFASIVLFIYAWNVAYQLLPQYGEIIGILFDGTLIVKVIYAAGALCVLMTSPASLLAIGSIISSMIANWMFAKAFDKSKSIVKKLFIAWALFGIAFIFSWFLIFVWRYQAEIYFVMQHPDKIIGIIEGWMLLKTLEVGTWFLK